MITGGVLTRRLVQCWAIAVSLTITTLGVSFAVPAAAQRSYTGPGPQRLLGVSCTVTTCQAVGQTPNPYQGYVERSLNGGGAWTAEHLPSSVSTLVSISCPTRLACFTVGTAANGHGLAVWTTSGGSSWTIRLLPNQVGMPEVIACPTPTSCEAFANHPGGGGIVLRTSSRGSRWSAHSLPPSVATVVDLSCSSSMVCEGIGTHSANRGIDVRTINGGLSWSASLFPADVTSASSIACPTISTCFALGTSKSLGGIILKSSNGGSTWNYRAVSGTGGVISCASITRCVGMELVPTPQGGTSIVSLRTSSGGSSWQTSNLPTDVTVLSHISCATSQRCVAAGTEAPLETHVELGVAARTTNGGVSWSRFK